MSRKQDPATRINELASILKLSHQKPAEGDVLPPPASTPPEEEPVSANPGRSNPPPPPTASKFKAVPSGRKAAEPPSPAPSKGRNGKSSDKLHFVYKGLYLRKDTEKQARRRLEDLETGQDFSELVEALLVKWLGETS